MARKISYQQAINEALAQEMRRDQSVFIIGQDVSGGTGSPGEQDAWGGVLGVTKGLYPEFPDRVLDAPLSEVGYVGMGSQMGLIQQPLTTGFQMTMETAGRVTSMIATLPVRLWDIAVSTFTGGERDPNGPLSVVGVGRLAGEVAATDAPVLNRFAVLLNLLGALNVALFVFNMIPLLPLDGGHIAVALWDGIRRAWAKLFHRPPPAPVDATRLVPLTVVVATLLIAMGALLLIADVFNPVDLLGG